VRELAAAGATVVEMGSSAPGPPARAAFAGDRTEEGWQRYFARHARPPYRTAGALLSSPRLLAFNRGRVATRPRLTAADVRALRREREQYKARLNAWMDANGVDAVVYPGLRSDVYDNDGAPARSADRETGIPTSAAGVPTLVLPAGANPHGDPLALQFLGRAGDDAKLLGYGYALEQRLGGHLAPTTAPRLPFRPAETRPGA
jgi:amidase